MKRLLLITVLLSGVLKSHSQDSLTVQDIDRIVAGIDANKKLEKDEYCDDLKLEVLTHYCEESLTDGDKGHLYRFTVKTTATATALTVYYFHNNELIKVLNEERNKTRLLKRRVLYYDHDRVIQDVAEGIHPSEEYFLQTAQEKVKALVDTTQ